jgi:hypothetical protein
MGRAKGEPTREGTVCRRPRGEFPDFPHTAFTRFFTLFFTREKGRELPREKEREKEREKRA